MRRNPCYLGEGFSSLPCNAVFVNVRDPVLKHDELEPLPPA